MVTDFGYISIATHLDGDPAVPSGQDDPEFVAIYDRPREDQKRDDTISASEVLENFAGIRIAVAATPGVDDQTIPHEGSELLRCEIAIDEADGSEEGSHPTKQGLDVVVRWSQ